MCSKASSSALGRSMTTEEQRKAGQELEAAIKRMVHLYGAKGTLGDWAVIACEIDFDEDGDVESAYSTFYNNGSVPTHVGMGLFRMGVELAMGRAEDEDDD